MKPKKHKTRTPFTGGQPLQVRDINDTNDFFDFQLEDGDINFNELAAAESDDVEEIQEQRIEALKRAIDIAKLMSNVTVTDIINIAVKVQNFINKK